MCRVSIHAAVSCQRGNHPVTDSGIGLDLQLCNEARHRRAFGSCGPRVQLFILPHHNIEWCERQDCPAAAAESQPEPAVQQNHTLGHHGQGGQGQ